VKRGARKELIGATGSTSDHCMNLVQSIPSHAANTSIARSIPIFVFDRSDVKKMIADIAYPALKTKLHGIAITAKIEAENESGEYQMHSINVSAISFILISGSSAKNVPTAKPSNMVSIATIDPFIGEQMPLTIAANGLKSLMAFIFLS